MILFWRSDATAAVAAQGRNLPAALTELDATLQGTRQKVSDENLPSQLQLYVAVRVMKAGAGLNITVSVRDAADPTTNILASVTFSGASVASLQVKGTFVPRPAWLTGEKTLAAYTEGGNGVADFIFREISLRTWP